MIQLDKLRLFPFATKEIFFPGSTSRDIPYNFVFFAENSNFNLAYRKLKIPKRFVRAGTVMQSVVPRLMYTRDIMKQYMMFKLLPIRNAGPSTRNLFIDTTPYLDLLDERYKRDSYRRPLVLSKLQTYLKSCSENAPNRKNILIYYVDVTAPIAKNVVNKRGWLLIDMFKKAEYLRYDNILIALWDGKTITYSAFKNGDNSIAFTRLYSFINSLKQRVFPQSEEQDNEDIAQDLVMSTKDYIDTDKETYEERSQDNSLATNNIHSAIVSNKMDMKTKDVLKRYLGNNPELASKLKQTSVKSNSSMLYAIKSILDLNMRGYKANNVVDRLEPAKYKKVLRNVQSAILPALIEHDKYKNESRRSVFGGININGITQNKNPSLILNKRKRDFNVSILNDLTESCKILSKPGTQYPLKLVSINKTSKPIDPGDLEPTKMTNFEITLSDINGKFHVINIEVPEIQDDGTFLINGRKKFMKYQIVIDPIFFLKPNQGTLNTMYAPMTVHLKETKLKSYFELYTGGYVIPLALFYCYSIGFDEMCKLYSITYKKINSAKEAGDFPTLQFLNGDVIVFNKNDKHIVALINSFNEIRTKTFNLSDLNDKTKMNDLIIDHLQNRNSTFKLDKVIQNIMEPVAVQILSKKMLPTTLSGCLHYISYYVAQGRVDARNDISKQRIRTSEAITFQIQKQLLASFSQYTTDREHGNEDAVFFCNTKEIIKQVLNDGQLINELDNINPYDELAAMTRVTPVGPGGVSDSQGIQASARNIDTSYFGNIDSMDTSENDNIGVLNHLTIDAAIGNDRGMFGMNNTKGNTVKSGALSVCSSAVPFVNHNDGCRVMFSGSQGRQAIPIVGNQQPLVQTGYETVLTSMLTDSYIKKAKSNGIVTKITPNVIVVTDSKGNEFKEALDHPLLKTSVGQIKGSLNSFGPVVKVGQRVEQGQILAEGKHIKDGVISVGRNLLTAIMGWKGYSFEDGYIISESVAHKYFTSMSYEEKEVFLTKDDTLKFMSSSGIFTKSGDPLLIRSSKDVEQLLNISSDEIIEGQHVLKSPGGKILSIEIYPNMNVSKFPLLINEYNKFKQRYEESVGAFPDKFIRSAKDGGTPFSGIRIVFKIERYDACVLGDKITNSHGGKGTLTLIEKDENMPVTPWGEKIDILFNPLAVINRMNPGTIYELYSAMVARTMAKRVVMLGYKKTTAAIELMSTIYKIMDATPGKKLSHSIISGLNALSAKEYVGFINAIIDSDYVLPIYVPPFQEPSKEAIRQAMRVLSIKTKYHLTLPEYGIKTLEPVAVGYLYYKKLEQQADYKFSARSTGKYNPSTGQATAGKSLGGGQRVGEYDSYALISQGATTVLKELFGSLSDDQKTKDQMISNIIEHGHTPFMQSRNSTAKDRMNIYMRGMMINSDTDQ